MKVFSYMVLAVSEKQSNSLTIEANKKLTTDKSDADAIVSVATSFLIGMSRKFNIA